MLPIARVFGLSLQTPLLAVLIGLMLAVELARRLASQRGLDGNTIANALANSMFAFVLGARLGYVFSNLSSYLKDPFGALALNTTAMLPWTGWLAAAVFAAWTLHRKHTLKVELAHVLLPAACVLGMGLAVSDLLSGNNFGTPTTLPWAINLWGALRHPVQVYEFLMLGLALIALLRINTRNRPTHAYIWIGIALVAFGRVWVDGFRAEVPLLVGLRVTQLAGVLITLVALWQLGEGLKPANNPIEIAPEVQQV